MFIHLNGKSYLSLNPAAGIHVRYMISLKTMLVMRVATATKRTLSSHFAQMNTSSLLATERHYCHHNAHCHCAK